MAFLLILNVIFLDQLSKVLISRFLSLNQSLPVINRVFYLTLIHNRGAAFGILKGQLVFLIITALASIVLIYLSLRQTRGKKLSSYDISLCLILAGGIGNLIDRLVFGYVIDFLDFRIWPVFNLADSAITVGAILLGLSILQTSKRKV